jgi:hypothetical protein
MSESEKTGDESETAENVEDMFATTRSGSESYHKLESFEISRFQAVIRSPAQSIHWDKT